MKIVDKFDLRLAVQPYRDKLAAFETAGEIKDFLVAENVKVTATRVSNSPSTTCAIATYLRRESGERVSVTPGTCMALATNSFCDLGDNTPAMQDFIRHFDGGRYPELEVCYVR